MASENESFGHFYNTFRVISFVPVLIHNNYLISSLKKSSLFYYFLFLSAHACFNSSCPREICAPVIISGIMFTVMVL